MNENSIESVMTSYLPTFHNVVGACGVALTVALLFIVGSFVTRPRSSPAVQLLAGWGIVCFVFTLWAVFTPWPLEFPLAGLCMVALLALILPSLRSRFGSLTGARRLLILAIPLWFVMLPVQPSEVDTWLNLLPNAAYLFDHGTVPWNGGPPSYSFLPGAPYNTQFVAFIASVASGSFADGAMGLFNIVLQLAAALLLAQVVAGDKSDTVGIPPWWACAAGFLLAIPLNPGFVPRVFFAPYGEAPIAVATLFAVWLAIETLKELQRGVAWPPSAVALALVLVALVNTKQSGPGLIAPVGITMLILSFLQPRVPRLRGGLVTVAALIPATFLFLIWTTYVHLHLQGGELTLLPVSSWNFHLGPIFAAIFDSMFKKATYAIFEAATVLIAIWQIRRDPWSDRGLLLGFCLGIILLYNAFLVFTYVTHFGEEHSYFRYTTHLSLLVMFALTVTFRPGVAHYVRRLSEPQCRRTAGAVITLVLVLPFVFIGLLRFDLATPMPEFRMLGHRIAQLVKPSDKLALLLPGDNGSVGSMLSGVIRFTPPRRPNIDIRVETAANPAMFATLVREGYKLAFVSCSPPDLQGVPPKVAAMMVYTSGGWHPLAIWPYPPGLAKHHFITLARGPACADSVK